MQKNTRRHAVEQGMLKVGHASLLETIEKDFLGKHLPLVPDQLVVQMKKCFDRAEAKLTMPL